MADLVSRKPKADFSGAPGSAPEEINALEHNPPGDEPVRDVEAMPGHNPGDGPTQEPDAQETAPNEILEPPAEETNVSPLQIDPATVIEEATPPFAADVSANTAPMAAADDAIDVASKKKVRVRKRPSVLTSQETSDAPAVEEEPAAPVGPKAFVEEMAALDLEVAALRRELAKKLSAQNAQLRRMLARFDGR